MTASDFTRGIRENRVQVAHQLIQVMLVCPSSDNLGRVSDFRIGGSGPSSIKFMRFQFRGASAA
ncbi:hypothetical protein [Sediminimonas sp.]|uniref:hypothetical protein n=1 Tax=Sediminimonas sp. TaxID=2823379 RepID=UPI0025E17F44|nr:hypothetical protein [Sediminimonas sp.]